MEIQKDRFAGKSVLVTGAGSGIGKATAERLAAEGAWVIASDIDPDRLNQLDLKGKGVLAAGDLTDPAYIDRLFEMCAGKLQGLANVAGIMDGFLPVDELDDATWTRVMDVNVTAVMRCTRAAVRLMTAAGAGAIVNVASEAALRGSAAGAAYTASKHAVVGLSKSAAFMARGSGVRINVVAPGPVRTAIDSAPKSEKGFAAVMSVLGAFRPALGEPEDIAAVICWLLSPESRNVNGALIASDGGWSTL